MNKTLDDYSAKKLASSAQQAAVTPPSSHKPTAEHADAISQLFTELEMSYHNQFHKAFPDNPSLTMAKQLWLRMLAEFSAEQIIAGGRRAIQQSDYLPTLHSLHQHCEQVATAGIPDARTAYLEACHAGDKASAHWSHPIVYYAGKASGWFFLSSQPEAKTYPVFERNYQLLLQRIKQGEELSVPIATAIEQQPAQPLAQDEQKKKLDSLRQTLAL